MSIEVQHSAPNDLPIGAQGPAGADATASGSAGGDSQAASASAGGAADPGGEARPKARMFQDDVRKAIVERHRQHRATTADPSLSAAQAESARVSRFEQQSDGEAGDTAAAGGSGGMGGPGGSPASPPSGTDARMVRVKVYGNEYSVPASVVDEAGGIENFQKNAAADVMLRRANEAARRAERAAQELEAQAQQRATIPAGTRASGENPGLPSGDTGDASTALKDESRELLDAMLDSNPDRVAQVLGKVVSKAAQANARATTAASSGTANPAAAAASTGTAGRTPRSSTEVATANAVFDTEFRAIRQNPEAMQIARDLVRSRMADSRFDATPLPELAREIGRQLAATIAPPSPGNRGADPNIDTTLALRNAAKRQMPTIQTGQSFNGNPAPAKPAPTREQKQQSYVATLRARSGSNATLAERRTSTQR